MPLAASILVLFAGNGLPADIREVNGVRVDLQPIHDWKPDGGTNRPMPHWKEFRIATYLGEYAGYSKCVLIVDGKSSATNLVKNLPEDVVRKFKGVSHERIRIENWKSGNKAEDRRIRMADASAPTGAAGSRNYVEAKMKERYQVERDAESLRQSKEDLEEAEKRLRKLELELLNYSDFAMFTGKTYSQMQIWDLGQKR